MDAVLFRSAMSPVIREQHDEFPMITDPRGRMVVGQFGAYINEMMEEWDAGHLPGRRDPHLRPVQVLGLDLAHERLARARADLLRGRARRLVVAVRPPDGLPAGRCPARCRPGAKTIFEEGIIIPPLKIIERGVPQEDVLELIFNNVRLPGDEPGRPVRDRRRLPRRREAGDRALRPLRQGDLPRRAAGAARPHVRGDADADPGRDPRGAADASRTTSTTTASATGRSR